jgi:hypothetical protein
MSFSYRVQSNLPGEFLERSFVLWLEMIAPVSNRSFTERGTRNRPCLACHALGFVEMSTSVAGPGGPRDRSVNPNGCSYRRSTSQRGS